MRIAILSAIWPAVVEQLQCGHDCRVRFNPDDAEKTRLLCDAEATVLRSPVRLDRPTLLAAPSLKLIVRAGSGMEAIDLQAAKDLGIRVVSVPLSADSVAEHTFGLLLALCRRIPHLHSSLVSGAWEKHSGFGIELNGRMMGLLGFGRIGQRTAELAAAFGMRIMAHDRSPERSEKQDAASRLGVRFVSITQMFRESDVVTIQIPLNPASAGLVDGQLLNSMKPTALLVNVGRGGIVDETALYQSLSCQRLAGAALDVFAIEPPCDSPLFTLENFVGTPHVAAQTSDAQRHVGEDVLRVIQDFAAGRPLSAGIVCV